MLWATPSVPQALLRPCRQRTRRVCDWQMVSQRAGYATPAGEAGVWTRDRLGDSPRTDHGPCAGVWGDGTRADFGRRESRLASRARALRTDQAVILGSSYATPIEGFPYANAPNRYSQAFPHSGKLSVVVRGYCRRVLYDNIAGDKHRCPDLDPGTDQHSFP